MPMRRAGAYAGNAMKSKNLRDLVRFSGKAPVRAPVFETERVWSELLCLERNQQVGPMEDPASEVVCTVVAGEVVVQLDRARKRVTQWAVVLVPPGTQLFVTNASEEPAVVMLTAAPPPRGRTDGETADTRDAAADTRDAVVADADLAD
jgi:quercetin dioxygenase-like cupin family protein